MNETDVAIVGGGITGTTLALALRGSGLRVTLLEAGAPPEAPVLQALTVVDYDARVSALTPRSQRLLARLGVWDGLAAARICPYTRMSVWDAEGTGAIAFDCAEVAAPALGYIAENRLVQCALNARLQGSGIDVRWQHPVSAAEIQGDGGCRLQFAYGGELACRLLVAADGARSPLRQQLGFRTREWDYGHHAIVATVATEKPHDNTAWQRFLPTGPLALLPLGGDPQRRFCSIVWSIDSDRMPALLEADDAVFAQALGEAFEFRLGRIEAVSARAAFPLRQCHAVSYVKPGVALLGDAAHAIHPLAGQGVNLGLSDAAVLAEELQRAAERGLEPGDEAVLLRYQRRRKSDNLLMMAAMDGFKRLFEQRALPVRWLRNAGMRGVGRVGPVKRALIRHAMGVE